MYTLKRTSARLPWILAAVILSASTATADSTVPSPREDPVPRIIGHLKAQARVKLKAAMPLAAKLLREHRSCEALFTNLEADGLELLAKTIYSAPVSKLESRLCRTRRAAALTTVGGVRTILCSPTFERLTIREAALRLLHEALHHAGLPEYPNEPDAMTSSQINRLVRKNCISPRSGTR